jgi:hypothetical protein
MNIRFWGNQMKFKIGSLIVVAILSIGGNFVAVANPVTTTTNPAGMAVDPLTKAFYSLGVCYLPQQLDCIQSVQVKDSTGAYLDATQFGTQTWTIEPGRNGNTMNNGDPLWTAPQTGATPFAVSAQLFTPSFVGDDLSTRGYLGVWASDLPEGFTVKVAVRTSWVKAQNLQFIADQANYSKEAITGGNLWTFSGTHSKVAYYIEQSKIDLTMLDPMDWSSQADVDYRQISFAVHHATSDTETSWWDPRCSDYGFTAQAFNSNAAGSPEWNYDEKYLEFNIFAPHLDASGALNSGFFRLWVHEQFAVCEWPGNTLVGADSLEALIVNENGSLQEDANLSVTNENGMIYLDAGNFHYSVPKFIIRPSTETSIPPTYTPPSAATLGQPRAPIVKPVITPTPSASPTLTEPEDSSEEKNAATEASLESSEPQGNPNSGTWIVVGIVAALASSGIVLETLRRRKLPRPRKVN